MNETGFTLYKGRMDQNELIEIRNQVSNDGIPVEISWDGDQGYLAVPNGYVEEVDQYTGEMRQAKSDADEAYLSSWMNIGEPGLARLKGEFDAEEYLEGPKKPAAD